jgi:hypothetical protein
MSETTGFLMLLLASSFGEIKALAKNPFHGEH